MGYVVLHIDKAPGNEAAMTAHIARTHMPPNAVPELTYLNEELVEFPEGVADRTEAINYRLDHAGLTRKIGTNQVRAIRIMLTGSHDDMKRIAAEGRIKEWCADNLDWLRKTYGEDNVVSAVLHLDESPPHIHAAVVPIVTGERRKVREKKPDEPGKRKYRKKSTARPRLCADDVMTRVKLKGYQDSYAAAMAKYGLQRGIDGSEARHVTTQEFYRNAIAWQQNLQDNIGELLKIEAEKRQAVEQLTQQEREARFDYERAAERKQQKTAELGKTEAELKTVKFKDAAAEAGSAIMDGISSVLGTSKIKRQEQEIAELRQEVTARDESIELLQQTIQTERADHGLEKANLKQETNSVQAKLNHIHDLFPYIKELMRWGNYCRSTGLNKEWTKALFTLKPYRYTGELHSVRYNQRFTANNVILQFKPDRDNPGGFRFTIDGKEDDEWFRQQRKEFYERIGINIEQTGRKRNLEI